MTHTNSASPLSVQLDYRATRYRRWVLHAVMLILLAAYIRAGVRASQVSHIPVTGALAPAMTLQSLHGAPIALATATDHRPTYLVFWSPVCGISQQEMPTLNAWAATRPDLRVVAVTGDGPEAVRAYLTENPMPNLTIVFDPGKAAWEAYGVYGTPTAFVLAPDGRVAYARAGGPHGAAQFDLQVLRLQALSH